MTTATALFIGRNPEIDQALSALRSGSSLVIKGRSGIGKRALLRQIKQRLEGSGRVSGQA